FTAVEVALGANPPQEDVARGLHQPLALDHALAVVREATPAEQRLEHGRVGLLDLQEERIAPVPTQEQQHPAACSHAAHTDDLVSEVGIAEALEQRAALARQRPAVAPEGPAELRLELGR